MRRLRALALACLAACGGGLSDPAPPAQPLDVTVQAAGVRWRLAGSLKYDALYSLDVMLGVGETMLDPEMAAEHARLSARLGPAEQAAVAAFGPWRASFGDDVAGMFALLARAAPEGDLPALISFLGATSARLADAEAISLELRGTGFSADERTTVGACLGHAVTLLEFMRRDGWEARWRGEPLARVNARIRALADALPAWAFDVIAVVNARGGKAVAGDTVTTYIVHHASGFGLTLGEGRLLLEDRPVITVEKLLSTVLHELAHDPFPHDPAFEALAGAYAADPFFLAGVNPTYPTPAAWFSEELTDAFEVVLAAALVYGPARMPAEHVAYLKAHGTRLAPVLFHLAQEEGFAQGTETFASFVLRMVVEGRLVPGELEAAYLAL